MPLINSIPERYEDGFKELGTLKDEDFDKIQKYLSDCHYVSSIEKLAFNTLVNEVFNLIEIEEIFLSVGSLVAFIEKVEIIEEIIQDVTSLCEIYELIKPEDNWSFLKNSSLKQRKPY